MKTSMLDAEDLSTYEKQGEFVEELGVMQRIGRDGRPLVD